MECLHFIYSVNKFFIWYILGFACSDSKLASSVRKNKKTKQKYNKNHMDVGLKVCLDNENKPTRASEEEAQKKSDLLEARNADFLLFF